MSEQTGTELPQTMLILKSQASSLVAAEIFLRNRGWKIYSTVNLKDALLQIATQKPSYVLITVDHANKKVLGLPKLLAQAFPVVTMVFAESQSATTFKNLNDSFTDYRVSPPVTGPAIERCVNKYLKDQQAQLAAQVFSRKTDNNEIIAQPFSDDDKPWKASEIKSDAQHVRDSQQTSIASKTLIARGAEISLQESVSVGDGVVKEKVKEATKAACLVIDSERFSGYLVAVMGKNCEIDPAFMDSVKAKLFKFLKDNGETVSNADSMNILFRPVEFEPWALKYADFLRKSVHEGNEVAMAFFPRRPVKTVLDDSPNKDMAKIQLKNLEGDQPVEFDLYVYLPANNKYVLYTPKGGVFYSKQIDRLKKQGITHMHVQKDSISAISKYRAQNYLNDLIDSHEKS